MNNIKSFERKNFFIRSALFSTLLISGCAGVNTGGGDAADDKYVLTPLAGAEVMPHPLYGVLPSVESKDAHYSVKVDKNLKVFLRLTAGTTDDKSGTNFIVLFKNLDPYNSIAIKPVIDVIDGNGQVRHIEDYKGLLKIAKEVSNVRSQSSSFFAYGNQSYVTSAAAGYAVGSVLSEMIASSNRSKASKIVQVIEQHWIKDEYTIPPQSFVDGIALLNGIPPLPIKIRITIGDKVFIFDSVLTLGEGQLNYNITHKN